MLKRLIKLGISLVVYSMDRLADAIARLLGRPGCPTAVTLYYHAVKPHQRAAFARQMDTLQRRTRPWTLEPIADAKPGRYAAVTFDDGFASVVQNALPELRLRDIPFTVFFPTGSWGSRPGWIQRPTHPSYQERILNQDELRALAREPLATIGSHSVSHPNFLKLDRANAAREFSDSKRDLESVLDRPIDLFSFPHGAHNADLVEQARAFGYRRVFTVEPATSNPADPAFVVGRVAVEPDDWAIEFRLKLMGAYRWQTWLRR